MIRRANIDDLDKIELLEKQFGADTFSRRCLRRFIIGNNNVFVIDLGGEIVGYLIALIRSNSFKVRLYSLMIDSAHRGKGYATEIVHFLERYSKGIGMREIGLEVRASNYPAISLYTSMGFEKASIADNYYPDGEAALKMIKKLQ